MVLVVWIFYTAMQILSGAEPMHVYSSRRGARVEPTEVAEKKEPVRSS